MKKCVLYAFAVLVCISCTGTPSPNSAAEGGASIPLGTITIINKNSPDGAEAEASVLFYPGNKKFVLRFPDDDGLTFLQYWDTDAQELFIRSVDRFLEDSKKGNPAMSAGWFYGKVSVIAEFEDPRYYGAFRSRPNLEFGYAKRDGIAFFSVTQQEAHLDNYPPKAMSRQMAVLFSAGEARKLAAIFALDPAPLVCFGDNVTSGYAAVSRGVVDNTRAYPAYLQEKIRIPVINAGGGSRETTERAIRRVEQDVLAYSPQIVLVFFGGNDLGQQIPWQETQKNLEEIIRKINDGKRKIFLVQFYTADRLTYVMRRWEISDAEKQAAAQGYDEMYRNLSQIDNVELIDTAWAGVWGEHMASDRSNPVAAGQEIMAENLFNAMRPFLSKHNFIK